MENICQLKRTQAQLSHHLDRISRLQELLEKEEQAIFFFMQKERELKAYFQLKANASA